MDSLSKIQERLQSLKDEGFDESKVDPWLVHDDPVTISVRCSQCAALVINRVACHEIGCPNWHKKSEEESEGDD